MCAINKINPAFKTRCRGQLQRSGLDRHAGICPPWNWGRGGGPRPLDRALPSWWCRFWNVMGPVAHPDPPNELRSRRSTPSLQTRSSVPPAKGRPPLRLGRRPRSASVGAFAPPRRVFSPGLDHPERRDAPSRRTVRRSLSHPLGVAEGTAAACSSGRSARPESDRDANRPRLTVGSWDVHFKSVFSQSSGSDPLRAFGKNSGTWTFPVPDLLSHEEP